MDKFEFSMRVEKKFKLPKDLSIVQKDDRRDPIGPERAQLGVVINLPGTCRFIGLGSVPSSIFRWLQPAVL